MSQEKLSIPSQLTAEQYLEFCRSYSQNMGVLFGDKPLPKGQSLDSVRCDAIRHALGKGFISEIKKTVLRSGEFQRFVDLLFEQFPEAMQDWMRIDFEEVLNPWAHANGWDVYPNEFEKHFRMYPNIFTPQIESIIKFERLS